MKERLTDSITAKSMRANKNTSNPYYIRLAEYEDLEEQGLLVRLLCKVGDKLYLVYPSFGEIEEWEITSIRIGYDVKLFRLGHKGTDDYAVVSFEEFGKTAFSIKADAENKLKKLRGE